MADRETAFAQFKRRISRSQREHPFQSAREPKAKIHWLDVWAPRLSNFAQFGLFLVTVGSLYFVVLPLYQKSVLEEAIARKETELKQATVELDKSYKSIRENAVRTYILAAGVQCSDLGLPPPTQRDPNTMAKNVSDHSKELFAIDIATCLASEKSLSYVLDSMRPEDKKAFRSAVSGTVASLVPTKTAALVEYNAVPKRISESPASLPELPAPLSQLLDLEAKWRKPADIAALRLNLTVDLEKSRVASKYGTAIRSEISKLRSVEWPTTAPEK